jgi:hypothetical protein
MREGGRKVKIAKPMIRRRNRVMEADGPFWEERLVRPIDIYPEYREQPIGDGREQINRRHLRKIATRRSIARSGEEDVRV